MSTGTPIEVAFEAGRVVVRPRGELDFTSVGPLEALLAVHRGADLTVDLTGVGFVDSSAIRVLVAERHHARLGGSRFCLSNADDAVHRIFEVTGVADLFEWEREAG